MPRFRTPEKTVEVKSCGGPTKLPAKGGGQQQRPGKEEPLVGWRKEGATDLKPLAKQGGGEEKAEEVWVARL